VVTFVSVSPDGKQVVSGSRDKTLRMWDMSTGQCTSVWRGIQVGFFLYVFVLMASR
jgi:WD40 repeat protein